MCFVFIRALECELLLFDFVYPVSTNYPLVTEIRSDDSGPFEVMARKSMLIKTPIGDPIKLDIVNTEKHCFNRIDYLFI